MGIEKLKDTLFMVTTCLSNRLQRALIKTLIHPCSFPRGHYSSSINLYRRTLEMHDHNSPQHASVTHSHEHDGHTHVHTHADGTTHSHSHATASSPEEALALLTYMLSHNRHHAEELHDLAHCFDEVSGDLVHEAVDKLEESNALLEQALSLLKNQ